jgi:hypothetical protein
MGDQMTTLQPVAVFALIAAPALATLVFMGWMAARRK